jgi:UDP-N-acetylglucosamine 1-carboxyvinyltransferase
MELRIEGGLPLFGTVHIDGAKNSLLPILTACLLIRGRVILHTVPKITDITNMLKIMSGMGVSVNINGDTVAVDIPDTINGGIDDGLARKIRGSIFIMGALLGRLGSVKLPYPGGCSIGDRPIDIHIDLLKKIGVKIHETKTHIECRMPLRRTARVLYLDFPSVGATENIILATVSGKREYKIVGAAKEPEIIDLCKFLNACGADIRGAGTDTITVKSAGSLHGCEYTPIPDRINTGSYMTAAVACGGDVTLKNTIPEHNANLIEKLKSLGAKITANENTLRIVYEKKPNRRKRFFNIHTAPYPGFPTDLQSQFAAAAATIKGKTVITENLFENRFRYVPELQKLGADITVTSKSALIRGSTRLSAFPTRNICPESYGQPPRPYCNGLVLNAADLRGGVALVIAALASAGTATITNAEYICRGHADIVRDLRQLGANIILLT